MAETLHVLFVGLLWLSSIPVLVYSYRKVARIRRILYAVALPIAVGMTVVYGEVLLGIMFGFEHLLNVRLILSVAVFLLAIEFHLVPFIDRLEEKSRKHIKLIEDTDAF